MSCRCFKYICLSLLQLLCLHGNPILGNEICKLNSAITKGATIEIFFMPRTTYTRIPVSENKLFEHADAHVKTTCKKYSGAIDAIASEIPHLKKVVAKYENIRILAQINLENSKILKIKSGNFLWINKKSYLYNNVIHEALESIVASENPEIKKFR